MQSASVPCVQALESENAGLKDKVASLQKQVQGLLSTTATLERNISCLFDTAKLEIRRKDKLVTSLRAQVEELQSSRQSTRRSSSESARGSSSQKSPEGNRSNARAVNHSLSERRGIGGRRDTGFVRARRDFQDHSDQHRQARPPSQEQQTSKHDRRRTRSRSRSRSRDSDRVRNRRDHYSSRATTR